MEVRKMFHRFIRRSEFYLLIVFVVICILIQFVSGGQLFIPATIFNILRAMVVLGMFALVNMMVVVTGGFDLSFPTLAALTYAATVAILLETGWGAVSVLPAFLIAAVIGGVLGMLNGLLIAYFKLNAMIVTLGTQTLFLGISLGLFEFPEVQATLPRGLVDFGQLYLYEFFSEAGVRSALTFTIVPFILLAVIVWFILNRTMYGRSLYAIGGSEISAERAGINVKLTKFILYVFVGVTAGIIGIIRVSMANQSIPIGLVGWDLMVIPAVILGGASIYGGVGTVFGTILAVALVQTVTNSLILVGIDSAWQDFFYGLVIIAGVTISAVQIKRRERKRGIQ